MGNDKLKWDQRRRLLEIQLKVRSFSNLSALFATLSALTELDQSSVEFTERRPLKLKVLPTLVLSQARVENGTIRLSTNGLSHQPTTLQETLWLSPEFQTLRTEEILLLILRRPSEE